MVCQRIAANNCKRLRVATEAVFQQERKLGITERDDLVTGLEALDYVGEDTQAFIDILCLLEERSLSSHQ